MFFSTTVVNPFGMMICKLVNGGSGSVIILYLDVNLLHGISVSKLFFRYWTLFSSKSTLSTVIIFGLSRDCDTQTCL